MKNFEKASLSAEEQLDLLISRGLKVNNYKDALHILKRNGYYHLSSYMRLFQEGDEHKFIKNIEFADIFTLANFDRKLRLLTFDAIAQIELSYRVAISNVLCKKDGSHWFYKIENFKSKEEQEKVIDLIKKQIHKSNKPEEYSETFIAKYYEKYDFPDLPPFWMIIETFTLGSLNILFNSLSNKNRKDIIEYLGFENDITFIALNCNWLQSLSLVRNICAHHSRLFNRMFKIKPKRHKKIIEFNIENTSSYYYIAMIINYYLSTINNDNSFGEVLNCLFGKYNYKAIMGFDANWSKFTYTKKQKHFAVLENK